MRNAFIVVAALAIATPLAAQTQQARNSDPTHAVKGDGALPAGWSMALDPKEVARGATKDQAKFVAMGSGYHFYTGPAGIYWNPKDEANGNYTVQATFTQEKKITGHGEHGEAYGLIAGGSKLDTPEAQYIYFIVRQDGNYMIRHRAGADDKTQLHTIVPWTESPAVNKVGDDGKDTNTLAIQVATDSVHFLANGKQVVAFSKAQMHGFNMGGQTGIRMNHNLDVHVSDFKLTK